jgi:hypothetical protein
LLCFVQAQLRSAIRIGKAEADLAEARALEAKLLRALGELESLDEPQRKQGQAST